MVSVLLQASQVYQEDRPLPHRENPGDLEVREALKVLVGREVPEVPSLGHPDNLVNLQYQQLLPASLFPQSQWDRLDQVHCLQQHHHQAKVL